MVDIPIITVVYTPTNITRGAPPCMLGNRAGQPGARKTRAATPPTPARRVRWSGRPRLWESLGPVAEHWSPAGAVLFPLLGVLGGPILG